jgi:cytochrome c553
MEKYYILWITIYGEDWEREEKEASLDKKYLKKYIDEYEEKHRRNGEYIPNISSIEYCIKEYNEEQIRDILTVNEYLSLKQDKQIF